MGALIVREACSLLGGSAVMPPQNFLKIGAMRLNLEAVLANNDRV